MKKVLVLATAAFLFTGVAFAGGDGKKCAKSKECGKEMKDCKMKEGKEMKDCCKKEAATASKTTTKSAAKKA
jgi:hypothetical protein